MTRNHRIDPKFYGKMALTLVFAAILEVFALWERIVWRRRIKAVRMEKPPVFIIGFWRSGTTLLHNLMCCDPGAAYTTTFQNVFPNLALSQGGWLKPLTNMFLPEKRPFDNVHMDMDNPQEEEFGMVNLQPCSLYNFFLFPSDFDRITAYEMAPDAFTDEELNTWQKAYMGLIAKAMLNTGGTRFMSKNPCNIARLPMLKEMFPGAKYIFIYRNPCQVVESFYLFVHSIFPGTRLQPVKDSFTREKAVKFYAGMMRRYFAVRDSIPAADIVEIRMEDFLKDPVGKVDELYLKLGLENSEEARRSRERFFAAQSGRQVNHYQIPEETVQLVNTHAGDIISRLGYPGRGAEVKAG